MSFNNCLYEKDSTIAAIVTPPGEGGVAIIRVSGGDALNIVDGVFSGPVKEYKSHTVHLGRICDGESLVDEALVIPMLKSRSYTGEDTVEIHCHGGVVVTRRVLEMVIRGGARVAQPGEFTFKAFMNGKMDLAQAEAVQSLIGARSETAAQVACEQLQGTISEKVLSFQEKLTTIAAMIEAWVDFPEEDIEFSPLDAVMQNLTVVSEAMQRLVDTFHEGKILQEGVAVCIVGAPNVGKSSLMNAILDKDRAIVTQIPGTTRDTLEESVRIRGVHIRLIDTAGIRDTYEEIEQEGIERSKKAIDKADIVIFVADASQGEREVEKEILAMIPKNKSIGIWNKKDLVREKTLPPLSCTRTLSLSAKEKKGLEELYDALYDVVWEEVKTSQEGVIVTNARHKKALENAIRGCETLIKGLAHGVSPEFLSLDMRMCLEELGTIIGTNISEDILTEIFSSFCIGK
jgi:tRNA modification GTPase